MTRDETAGRERPRRRDFLKLTGIGALGGVAAAASTIAPGTAEAATSPTAAGYRETEHVKRVYDLARF